MYMYMYALKSFGNTNVKILFLFDLLVNNHGTKPFKIVLLLT